MYPLEYIMAHKKLCLASDEIKFILKAGQEKLNEILSVGPFGPPSSLIRSVHLHYTLTTAPQRWKHLLNHKDPFLSFF